MNAKLTPKERGLIKGAIRRVFARSDLRKRVLDRVDMAHKDSNRPRVRKWSLCPVCNLPSPKYLMVVDHINPVIPLDKSFEDMSLDEVLDRMWCEENNLQPICPNCHIIKTKGEKDERQKFKSLKRASKTSGERRVGRGTNNRDDSNDRKKTCRKYR